MTPRDYVELIAAGTVPLALICTMIDRWLSKRGLGVRPIQFLAVATFVPALIVFTMERVIDGSTVAALIGAFIGYLFSNIGEFDRSARHLIDKAKKDESSNGV